MLDYGLSAGQLPFLAVGFARVIDRAETCRFCSRASGLPLRTCVRSPARTGGGTFLASVAHLGEMGHVSALRVPEGRATVG